ncbi:MAG: hypothetical protein ACJAZ9_002138 [Neolewinella sp.]|jgi:hypothetical protein
MKITETEFKKLKATATPAKLPIGLHSLGEFHSLPTGEILFGGKEYWAEGEFMVLESLSDLIEFDSELEKIIPRTNQSQEPAKTATSKADDRPFHRPLEVDGQIENIDEARRLLATEISVALEQLVGWPVSFVS